MPADLQKDVAHHYGGLRRSDGRKPVALEAPERETSTGRSYGHLPPGRYAELRRRVGPSWWRSPCDTAPASLAIARRAGKFVTLGVRPSGPRARAKSKGPRSCFPLERDILPGSHATFRSRNGARPADGSNELCNLFGGWTCIIDCRCINENR